MASQKASDLMPPLNDADREEEADSAAQEAQRRLDDEHGVSDDDRALMNAAALFTSGFNPFNDRRANNSSDG